LHKSLPTHFADSPKPTSLQVAQMQGVIYLLAYSSATLFSIKALSQAQVLSVLEDLHAQFTRSLGEGRPAVTAAFLVAISTLIHASEEAGLNVALTTSPQLSSESWNSVLLELLTDLSAHAVVHSATLQGMGALMGVNILGGGLVEQGLALFKPSPVLQSRHK